MKTGFLLGLVAASFSLNALAKETVELKTDKQKFSYTAGFKMAESLQHQNIQLDAHAFAQGIVDSLQKTKARLTDEQMRAAVETQKKKAMDEQEAQAKKNLDAGKAFLDANKKKPGVTTLASGLQYKVIAEGKGKQPKASDTVVAHYRGTTINGAEFDSSYKRNEPMTFPVSGVIKGWQEALPLMKEGAKWQIYVPAELAYGPAGAGGAIGPNEVLIFDIELISVKDAAEAKDKENK